ncbi:MAG: hypothetical protein KAW91_03300 [candidate division Zixibacteria bacterium]|nr:hypothetical protein [candidate division Zixibacteria bacterium]
MAIAKSSAGLISKLRLTLLKQRLVSFAAGLVTTAAVILATWIILSLLANVVILPVWLKLSVLILSAMLGAFLFAGHALVRLFHGSVDGIAIRLEQLNPALKGRLVAAVQFARMRQTPGYSTELMALTEHQALKYASLVNFGRAVSFYPVLRTGRMLALAAVVALALVLVDPGLFTYSYEVYSHPTTEIAPPLGYEVFAFPGSVEWIKYRDIEIGAVIVGDRFPETALIYHRLVGGDWQRLKVDLARLRRSPSPDGDSLTVSTTLRQINKSFDYYVEAGRIKTEIQQVDVVDRPRVNGIKLSIFYPEYTELPPTVIDENNGSFSAVVGRRVTMKVTTNLPVRHAELVFSDSSRTPLEVTDKSAETALRIDSSRAYYIRLTDHLGEENPDPIEYYITAVPDEYPAIDVLRPGFDVNLGDDMILPLKVRIFDDYGFSSLALKYQIYSQTRPPEEHVAILHFSDRIKTEGEVEFNWDIDRLNLFPGDYVTYLFEVADNDRISGPKVTLSRQFVARLPSLEEIIAEAEGTSARQVRRTEELLRTGREVADRFKNISRKLQAQQKDFPKADWQHQKELSAVTEKNAELVEKIEKSAEQMEKAIDKLAESSLMNRQILEKLVQIQKLFEEVATPEMKEAQRKLMEALKSMDRKALEKAISDYQMSMEELLERLERTLALLKKLQLEQKMEAMIRQAEELAKKQESVNQKTDSTGKDQLPALSDKEDEIQSSLQDLKKEVEELKSLAREASKDQSLELQKFADAVMETDADNDMQEMSQALSKKQKEQATDRGKEALSKLLEMLDEMQEQLAAMQGEDESEVEKAMRMALEDCNYLSRSQEQLHDEASLIDPQSVVLHDMAAAQQDLQSACNGLKQRVSELGKQSPFVAAELQSLVHQATQSMDLATQGFEGKQGTQATREQREAMVNLNRAAIRLMESIQQQSQCKNGSNCDKNVNKLQSLCDKQNSLNRKTQRECSKPGGEENPRLGEQGREALQRLAGEQEAVRKSLEQISEEFGDSRQILGRLDAIAADMKKVEEDLSGGDAGLQTTERQLKIYSRMLEASRSLQRRDFTEQRKAATATSDIFHVPPGLSADLRDDRVKLEDRLRRYLSDEYPPQYEEQIKAYFKALLQIESQPGNTLPSVEPPRP